MTSNSREVLSVVVPVYNEEALITASAERFEALSMKLQPEMDVEIIFVDDGSKDASLSLLQNIAKRNRAVKIISLSRNFGHQIAITAGIDFASGDFVAIIDADLQDPPELIEGMYRIAKQGHDVVYGKRRKRAGESFFKKSTAAFFYRFLNYMCEIEIPNDTGDFRLMSRKAVDAFKKLRERNRFIRGMIPWLGFKAVPLEYDRAERYAGTTKYPLRKMIAFATNAILSFSRKPLTLATRLGFFITLIGMVFGVYMLYAKLFTNIVVPGVAAIILCIITFSGVQIMIIGVLGEYIARIFEEVQGRPLYFVDGTVNFPDLP